MLPFSLVACSGGLKIYSDKDPKTDIKPYKSYAWIAKPGDSVLNAGGKGKMFGPLIVRSANEELKKKGMTLDIENPDALFLFDTKIAEKIKYGRAADTNVDGAYYGVAGVYYAGTLAPVRGGEIMPSEYEEGLLYFNMYDTKTGKLLWSGGATKELTASDDGEKIVKNAVKSIFGKLPIKHKTK